MEQNLGFILLWNVSEFSTKVHGLKLISEVESDYGMKQGSRHIAAPRSSYMTQKHLCEPLVI